MKTASSIVIRAGLLSLTLISAASAQCDPDYSGVTLNVGTRTRPFIANAIAMAAKGWEKQTCGKIKLLEFPVDQLYPTYLNALVAGEGKFDVITFGPFWTPDFAPYLSDMPASMQRWRPALPNSSASCGSRVRRLPCVAKSDTKPLTKAGSPAWAGS